jgi:hypothetical protein
MPDNDLLKGLFGDKGILRELGSAVLKDFEAAPAGLDVDAIEKVMAAWKVPADATKEKDCETALREFLHAAFPKDAFQRQYQQGNTSADLRVKAEGSKAQIAIELKYQLVKRSEYHRLIGQLWTYVTEWEHDAVLVLCGDCDTTLVRQAERFGAFLSEHTPHKVRVVSKGKEQKGIQTSK